MSRRVILYLTLAVVFAAAFLVWNDQGFSKIPLPCEKTLAYNIGIFDRRFNITQKDFLNALSEAEAIWEEAIDKELFIYSPETADLSVNLIYDYRQETTKTLENISGIVEENESTYNAIQSKYIVLKAEYDDLENSYYTRVKIFNEQSDAYQEKIELWNRGKRNSKTQFDELEKERIALQSELAELKALERQLNERAAEINSLVATLNRLATLLNLSVKKYNEIGDLRGESFTGGLYHSTEDGQGIEIYEFSSREKLVRILAHELGHALGLRHVDDPEAIMYYLNEGDTGVLTQADLAALQALCYTEDIKN